MPDPTPFIVAIDGPAGVGKSTLARRLARALGIAYLDTGAMFRLAPLLLGPDFAALPEEERKAPLAALAFSLTPGQNENDWLVSCNGVPADGRVRTETVAAQAARLGGLADVRACLKEAQQALGASQSLVAEGRDMGTAVFPGAAVKFFLDAAPEIRAGRRVRQLELAGQAAEYDEILAQIIARDAMDRSRPVAPLAAAPDAVVVDTGPLDLEGVFSLLYDTASNRLASR